MENDKERLKIIEKLNARIQALSLLLSWSFSNMAYNTIVNTSEHIITETISTFLTYDRLFIIYLLLFIIKLSTKLTKHHAIINLMTQCSNVIVFLKLLMTLYNPLLSISPLSLLLNTINEFRQKHYCRSCIRSLWCTTWNWKISSICIKRIFISKSLSYILFIF